MAGVGPLGENFEAQLINEAAARAAEDGGGASTTVRLARAMAGDLQRRVADGADPQALKAGLAQAVEAVAAELGAVAESVTSKEQLAAVAATALLSRPPGDPTDPDPDPDPEDAAGFGAILAEAMDKVGVNGVITVAESNNPGPELELTEGLRFGNGFLSPYFATDPERMEAVLDHPYVLLADTTLASVDDLIPILEQVIKSGRPLLVVAEDVVAEALGLLTVNKIRGVLSAVAVKAPGFGPRRAAILQDLAILTGAEVGGEVRNRRLDQLGRAGRVIVGKDDTIIVDGAGEPARIAARVQDLRSELEQPLSDWDRLKVGERLTALSNGVAVIKVGAPSERMMNERRRGVEDAVRAVRAAVADGTVGAGEALSQAGDVAIARLDLSGDEAAGASVLRAAISGLDETSGVALRAGGLVPAKAVSSELRNAASVAALTFDTEGIGFGLPGWHYELGEGFEVHRPEIAGQEEVT
jgi:chaperonin GroEL